MKNPITELKINNIYFQEGEIEELDSSFMLLRKDSPTAEIRLYNIKGANRKTIPKIFAVTDKDKGAYKIVAYEPINIGGDAKE
ncbi:MAG: hypothetical protein AVO34_02305 [Firmicutes bacterium ML8_F2]|jgi:hypothetical protein|nr:MAG: hypothetical protein AVO34_02305 [Firmicutes bacterium ML8_F2]